MHAFAEQPENTNTELELNTMQRPRGHDHFQPLNVKQKKNNNGEHFSRRDRRTLGALATLDMMIGVDAG